MNNQKHFPQLHRVMDVFGTKANSQTALNIMTESANYSAYISSHARDMFAHRLNDPEESQVKLTAMNQVGGFNGIGILFHDYNGVKYPQGLKAYYLKRANNDLATIVYWNGKFRVQSVNNFIAVLKTQGVSFKTGAL